MRLTALLTTLFLFFGATLLAQQPVETSATTHDVKINEDKKIKTSAPKVRNREGKGKSVPKDRPERKRHKSLSESGVFKRHNHFKASSARSRERGTRRSAPSAPKK